MKLWVDDVRPAPKGYYLAKSVYVAIEYIKINYPNIELLDLDHDAGDYI